MFSINLKNESKNKIKKRMMKKDRYAEVSKWLTAARRKCCRVFRTSAQLCLSEQKAGGRLAGRGESRRAVVKLLQ